MRKCPPNKKYGFFLFFLLAFMAIFYLTFITDISYSLNIPLTMTIIQTGMNKQTVNEFIRKTTSTTYFYKPAKTGTYRNSSYLVCLECQNIPVSYRNNIISNYKFFEYIPVMQSLYVNNIIRNIFHPPQTNTCII